MLERCGFGGTLSLSLPQKKTYRGSSAGNVMRLSRSHSSQHRSSQEKASNASFRSFSGLFCAILHFSLYIAAFVLGFSLSDGSRLVVISMKAADYASFGNGILKSHRSRSAGAVVDDRKAFTPSTLSESPPPATLKSSRVHVGRHEILIRSWPHPDPVQTLVAHQLIERVQQEQQQLYGVQERKPVVVVTLTYVRALQAVYLSSLIHTLRIAPGPLIWIVVEAGGHSNETAELLSLSKLFYYHLAVQEPMPTDLKSRKQLEIQLRLEGLRFVRNKHVDGIVIFVDDGSILNVELFDIVQKTSWFGRFSGVLFSHSEAFSNLEAGNLHSVNSSKKPGDANLDSKTDTLGAMNLSNLYTKFGNWPSLKDNLPSRFSLSLMGPVCSPEEGRVGWHLSSSDEHEQSRRYSSKYGWAGFALNSRIFWDDTNKPTWIKSWNDLLVESSSSPESPFTFLWNSSYIEPLSDCGGDIMVWLMGIETNAGSKFPSRWIISPPLEVMVRSRKTPWSAKFLVNSSAFGSSLSPPPPPPSSAHLLSKNLPQHGKRRVKRDKSRIGKHRSHRTKDSQVKGDAESVGSGKDLKAILTQY